MPATARVERPSLVARVLLGIGAVGVVAGLLGTVVGLGFLTSLDRALQDSLGVTTDAVDALGGSVEVAGDTLAILERTLSTTAATTRDLGVGLRDAEAVLTATAELSEQDLAGSLEAVQGSLPALIQVASVIDTTLGALSAIPFGPDYDPTQPFDDSLRAVQVELDGVPDSLREQAGLIREGATSLGAVREGTGDIADDLEELQTTLASASGLVGSYAATAAEARAVVTDNQAALERQLAWARVLVVVLGLSFVAGQLVPLGLGWLLLRPARLERLLHGTGPEWSGSGK
ncbi:hypothetical protein [Egicoccus halophilus]|uniref:Uncharacterized protein n=1 Tax=Egicoccus halophilus TaxID=1670830 RepID=A0A8J3A864_9ACTN|nr:hypothetical protein [Egicoccus halophilus]GGI06172.1 hypothetical protein GCM10011354_17760 [Egicoccus halophilus]